MPRLSYYRCKQNLFSVILVINLLLISVMLIINKHVSNKYSLRTNLQLRSPDDTKIIVAIGGGITSNKLSEVEADNVTKKFLLFSMLIPSFCNTVGDGWKQYDYHFYFAYDAADQYFSQPNNINAFQAEFHDVLKRHCGLATASVLHLLQCEYSGRPAWAQNDAMIAAYLNGAEYFYRINDDTVLLTANWMSAFTSVLNSYQPRNFGVVGPKHDRGNLEILTYDFVHRTHIEIFGFYYPRVFTDWFADDWITNVYAPQHVTKLANVSIQHRSLLGQRYFYDSAKARHLLNQIMSDRYMLARHMYHINHVKTLQKTTMVIAVSLASSEQAELWGVVRNAQLIRVYFPGWTLRIYMKQVAATSDVHSESARARVISTLLALGADIVYVDTRLAGCWWSYMIADDLSVDFALVRKPNSRLCEHDAMAVKDWIELCEKSPHVAVHCIRDTTYHGSRPMMHGLWGVRPSVLHHLLGGRSFMSLIQQFVNDSCGRSDDDDDGCEPSDFLSQMLWPVVQRDAVVCHDSVSHGVWPNSLYFHHVHSHTVAECVGAEYDGHEQLVTGCDSDDHSPTDMVSNDNVPELLV